MRDHPHGIPHGGRIRRGFARVRQRSLGFVEAEIRSQPLRATGPRVGDAFDPRRAALSARRCATATGIHRRRDPGVPGAAPARRRHASVRRPSTGAPAHPAGLHARGRTGAHWRRAGRLRAGRRAATRMRACCSRSDRLSSRPSSASTRSGCSASTRAYSGNAASGCPRAGARRAPPSHVRAGLRCRHGRPRAAAASIRRHPPARAESTTPGQRQGLVRLRVVVDGDRAARLGQRDLCDEPRPMRASPSSGSMASAASYSSRAPVPSTAVRRPCASASAAWSLRRCARASGHRRSASGCAEHDHQQQHDRDRGQRPTLPRMHRQRGPQRLHQPGGSRRWLAGASAADGSLTRAAEAARCWPANHARCARSTPARPSSLPSRRDSCP